MMNKQKAYTWPISYLVPYWRLEWIIVKQIFENKINLHKQKWSTLAIKNLTLYKKQSLMSSIS